VIPQYAGPGGVKGPWGGQYSHSDQDQSPVNKIKLKLKLKKIGSRLYSITVEF
jgi:hypothetical protein